MVKQFLMSFYLFLSDRHGTSSGSRWIIMGFAVKVAQSVRFSVSLFEMHLLNVYLRSDYVGFHGSAFFGS